MRTGFSCAATHLPGWRARLMRRLLFWAGGLPRERLDADAGMPGAGPAQLATTEQRPLQTATTVEPLVVAATVCSSCGIRPSDEYDEEEAQPSWWNHRTRTKAAERRMGAVISYLDDATSVASASALCVAYAAYAEVAWLWRVGASRASRNSL